MQAAGAESMRKGRQDGLMVSEAAAAECYEKSQVVVEGERAKWCAERENERTRERKERRQEHMVREDR